MPTGAGGSINPAENAPAHGVPMESGILGIPISECRIYSTVSRSMTELYPPADSGAASPPLKFINYVIEEYAMQVTYDPVENTGTIIYNLSLIKNSDLEYAIEIFRNAFRAGLSVSDRIKFVSSGETINGFVIPEGCTAVCTMCTITLDGLLLRRGIPCNPIGGGVVEIRERVPERFVHFIHYNNTTIDPLEVLVSQEITSITRVIRQGSGNILGSMRECHMESEMQLGELLDQLENATFTGILDIGVPNVSLLGVPVSPQYMGVAMVGGTNPMAAIKESGRWIVTKALKGLMDIETMEHIEDY
jgi:global nitrogen regulator NrpRII